MRYDVPRSRDETAHWKLQRSDTAFGGKICGQKSSAVRDMQHPSLSHRISLVGFFADTMPVGMEDLVVQPLG